MTSKGAILVTGANGGLGSAIVQNIISTPGLASNYTGIYAVRNQPLRRHYKGFLLAPRQITDMRRQMSTGLAVKREEDGRRY